MDKEKNVFRKKNIPLFNMVPAQEHQKKGSFTFQYKKFTAKDLKVLANSLDNESYRSLKPDFNLESCETYTEIRTLKNHPFHGSGKKQITYIASKECPIFVFDYGEWQKIYMPLISPKKFRYRYVGNYVKLEVGI